MGVCMIHSGLRRVVAWFVTFASLFSVFAVTPKHGWLKTEGAYLLNEKGNIVQLKGMSFYWSTTSWPGYKYYNAGTVNSLVDDWKCTVVRAAYDRNPNSWNSVKEVIQAAINKGIYVIIDWHCHDAHANPNQGIDFFIEQANAYKTYPNVIFEPYNEPIVAGEAIANDGSSSNAVKTWVAIKPYLTDVTKAIRNTGSKNLIILGTPYYCQHVDVATNDQVVNSNGQPFENVAYAFHFYAASHGPEAYYVERDGGGQEQTYIERAIGKIPLFVTEWGTTHRDGGEGGINTYIDTKNTEYWFDNYINQFHISHCNWSVSDFQASSAFSGGTNPSQSGQIAQKYIKQTPDEWEPPWKTGLEGPAKDSVFSMPVSFHAASRFNIYYGTHAESTTVEFKYRDKVDRRIPGTLGYTVLKVTPSEEANWVMYNIKSTAATKCMLVRYLAAEGKGKIEFLIDETKGGELTLATPTNTSEPWTTAAVPLNVAAGTHTLKLNFVNTTGSYYCIEWFELFEGDCSTPVIAAQPSIRLVPPGISTTRKGFTVRFSDAYRFTGFSLFGADGRIVKTGANNSYMKSMTINNLPFGIWFLKLDGREGAEFFTPVVSGH